MPRSWSPAVSVARVERHGSALQRTIQPAAAGAAVVVLIVALTSQHYYQSRWPLSVTAAILGLGLVVGRLAQRAGQGPAQRAAHTVAAVAALSVVVYAASGDEYFSPRWPLTVAAVLLGLGLIVDPLARLAARQPAQTSSESVAAAAGLGVLILALMHEHYFQSRWPLSVTAVVLGVGLVAGRVAQFARSDALQRTAPTTAVAAGLAVLIYALSSDQYFTPRWPLSLTGVLLALGLIAGRLTERARRPREQVLSERVDELSRTRRGALDVQASELRRIERDLHDGAQVRLVALSMKLGRAEDRYRDDAQIVALLREAREDAAAAIRELRELARGIAPPVLSDRGLEAAVGSLAQRSGADVTVSGRLSRRPLPAVEVAAYFVVAESLTNAAKHAPDARVEIRIDERGGDLFVEVTDFGPGGADTAGGGLTGLRQRVEALDGTLHVTSPAGVGTQVEAVLPCG